MITVAALFVRADSVYKTMPGVDAWDEARDARGWPGGCAVVAHPPCRLWGKLRPQRGVPRDHRKIVTKAEREHTPPPFAAWLVETARRTHHATD